MKIPPKSLVGSNFDRVGENIEKGHGLTKEEGTVTRLGKVGANRESRMLKTLVVCGVLGCVATTYVSHHHNNTNGLQQQ